MSAARNPRPVYIGVIGCGQWGPNHIRNFNGQPGCRVLLCADIDRERLGRMKGLHPQTRGTPDYREILDHPYLDAVVVATPTGTHHRIVSEALAAGKDVLVEKPLADSLERARALEGIARRRKRILMVGHTFLFNSGIRRLKEYLRAGTLGRVYSLNATRTNLGPIRNDVSATWDLASHDISIFNYLLGAQPRSVSAAGERFVQKGLEDVAFITLSYPKKVLANIHVSWLNPRKVREITIVGASSMIVWDDLDGAGPIRIYDKKVVRQGDYRSFGEFQLLIKEGDLTMPRVELIEPLRAQAEHFLECVRRRRQPLSNGRTGVEVVRVLAAIDRSMRKNGAPVAIG
jgi:predicted dehydrogenase